MAQALYIRPIAFADSAGEPSVRLGGSRVSADRYALIVREDDGSVSHRRVAIGDMAATLARLPASLAAQGAAQWAALGRVHPPLACGAREVALDRPQLMGILNLTPDSFSDGGRFSGDPALAEAHAAAMLAAGAAIVDVGGESTRPGAAAVSEREELDRVVPVIERLAAIGAPISVDTRRAAVMEAALAAGAQVVNDVSALRHDPRSLDVVARSGAAVVLMHAPGSGADLHAGARYRDVVLDVFDFLQERRDAAIAAGIARERIVLDPGIGFGKSLADNLALMAALPLFHALGQPLLVGASRKRMIAALAGDAPPDRRLGGSLALALGALDAGVQLLRVHDVAETVQAVRVWSALRGAALLLGNPADQQ